MIKLLIISGSPVKDSSTDTLLAEACKKLRHELGEATSVRADFIKLNDLKYIPCQACGKAPTPDYCFFTDDMTKLYPLVAECDCLLFGSPVYFDSVSGQAKMFIDRCNCFRPYDFDNKDPDHDFIKLLNRKRPGGMVLVGGDAIGIEGARRTIAGFFKWIEVTNEGVVTYSSSDDRKIGTVTTDESAMSAARALGAKLAEILRGQHER
ncbi:MAG: flavodoxin family protein [Candidatus Zixiibacteriota bacterium]